MAIYFVFTIELNLLLPCFGLSALYCTCAYTEAVDPARRPSIPQVRQGSVRFNLKEEEPPPPIFPSCCILILWSGVNIYFPSSTLGKISMLWRPGIRKWITRNPGDILYYSFSLFLHVLLEIHLYCQLLHW